MFEKPMKRKIFNESISFYAFYQFKTKIKGTIAYQITAKHFMIDCIT